MDQQEAELRIKQEWEMVKDALKDDRLPNIAVKLRKQNQTINYFIWDVTLKGRDNTLFEGGKFKGIIEFTKEYPNNAPRFIFSKVLIDGKEQQFQHINVFSTGKVCLDILTGPAYNKAVRLTDILLGVEDLLYRPNELSPANSSLCKIYQGNKDEYENILRKQTQACQ